ncbi:serine/threonine protein kinase [Actinospica sp. MGRD01-02]|uniref:non-specific serine/threonine protein kinase n=1 Tax=Actinospica acidithermotolerans TaxID=2828514 RepID=A0A941IJB5_9ACTN|nr:serine/threonine-protein kinase [Actinospica acidithermotolerans]MBR7829274.1 serine/threonine protein kinase [Actinospica acidithermotolerans]
MGESPPGAAGDWVVPGYEHERPLGAGATGRVVLARHIESGAAVAIKYLDTRSAALAGIDGGFAEEARILSTLRSPNITALYEYVEGPAGSAIVMELVEGVTLRVLLREEGATGPEAALAVLKGSLLGLAAAHEAGVVHRDYKPDNVLVTPEGASKLVDFGLASRFGATPAAAGTPVYMAPERFSKGPASAASDVYAATATFFECVTGARPYSGTTVIELMAQHNEAPIPDELAPEPLRPLVRAGLAKAPEERPSSAAEFVAELEEIARAAYGEDWEERGQRKLATVVAALPLLLLRGAQAPPAEAATDFALTNLGAGPTGRSQMRRARGPVAATVGILVVALLISLLTKPAASVSAGATVQIATTVTAGGPTPTGPAALPAAAASATPTATAASSQTSTASAGSTAPKQSGGQSTTQPSTGTGTATTSAATSASSTPPTQHSTTAAPPPSLTVDSVQITVLGCQGLTGAYATVQVTSDGKASGTLTFTWFSSPSSSGAHTADGTPTVVSLAQGQTSVKATEMHDFSNAPPAYWGVEVTTDPAAASGNGSSETLYGPNCEIQ